MVEGGDNQMQNLKLVDYTKKRLDDMYLVVYAIKNDINIKKGDIIENIDIYTFVGINKRGIRQLVGIYQDRPLNNRYWLDIFENFKSRGLNTILFLSVDDNKNLKRTAKIAFPMINFIDSLTFVTSRFDKYVSEKSSRKVASRIHRLYSQNTLNEYKNEFNSFTETYNNIIHKKLIEKYLNNLEGYYKYSVNIRNLLFKPSANSNIYDRIRLAFNSNEKYITDLNEIYEKLESMDRFFGFISFNKKQWTLILNDLMQLFPDIEFI
mgnify:FL=1